MSSSAIIGENKSKTSIYLLLRTVLNVVEKKTTTLKVFLWDTRIEYSGDLSNGYGYFYQIDTLICMLVLYLVIFDSAAHSCNDTYTILLNLALLCFARSEYTIFFTAVSIKFFCSSHRSIDLTTYDESTFSSNYTVQKMNRT